MSWRRKEPGHQQEWYWLKYTSIFWFQHQEVQYALMTLNPGFPRLPNNEIPGLLQDSSRTFSSFPGTYFYHIMPSADDDGYGKYDTKIGEVIWHGHHKAVSEYIHWEMCIDTCIRLVMMDLSIKIYRHDCKYICIYVHISFEVTMNGLMEK